MNSIQQNQTDGFIECEVCIKEIPVSEARSEEASEYVAYFFGMECYAKWTAQPEKAGEMAGHEGLLSD